MKLILRADVDSLGNLGDIVTVKPGYGRNFLIPQGLAMPASNANLKQFELERRKLEAKADSLRAAAKELAEKIEKETVVIEVRVGEGDKLYGSVTSSNIADVLEGMGLEIDRKKIILAEPIRALGDYVVPIKLHPDVQADIAVKVARHGRDLAEDVVIDESVVKPVDAEEVEAVLAEAETGTEADTSDAQPETEPESEPEQPAE